MPGSSNPGPGAVPNTTALPAVRSFIPSFPIGETGNSSIIVQADIGALTLTGQVPTIVNNVTVPVGLGALTLTGFVPVLATAIIPGVGSATLSGLAPVLASNVIPNVGALSLAGLAPVIAGKLNADVGILSLSGFAPSIVQTQNITLLPDVGLLSIDGFAPELSGIEITVRGGDVFVRGRRHKKRQTKPEREYVEFEPTVLVTRYSSHPVEIPKARPVAQVPIVSVKSVKLDQVSPAVVSTDTGGSYPSPRSVLGPPSIPGIPRPVESGVGPLAPEPLSVGGVDEVGTQTEQYDAPAPRSSDSSTPSTVPVLCHAQTGELTLAGWSPSVMVTDDWKPSLFVPPAPWTPEEDDDIAIIAALYSLMS